MNLRLATTVVACLALVSAAHGQDLRATLMETDRAFSRATSARGIDGWVEFAADDAVFMPDGVDFVRGREAVRAFYTPMFSRTGFSLTWEPIEAVVSASGDLGYTLGLWKSSSIGADGRTVTSQGKYVTIWTKQKDGSWKAVVDAGNTTLAAVP